MTTYKVIDIGSAPNAKDGDTARSAFRKVNENFAVVFGDPSGTIVNQNTNFIASSYKTYDVDTTLGVITASLPASPERGDQIAFVDGQGNLQNNNLIISFNGSKYQGASTPSITINTQFDFVKFLYVNSTIGWIQI